MNTEYLQLVRLIKLEASGGANEATINFESGLPYHHLTMWVHASSTATVNVTAQPLFGGVNDGSSTAVGDSNPKRVFVMTNYEIRPSTTIVNKHPSDSSPPRPLKSALKLTNAAAAVVEMAIYITAIPALGE